MQQHEVAAAADALLAERARPTVERVRAKIGRGSPNTVAPMLEVWFAGLAPRLGLGPQEEGSGLPGPVQQAMQVLWETACGQADAQVRDALAADRKELEAQRAALHAERGELTRLSAAAGDREALVREAADQMRRQVDDLTARLAETRATVQLRDEALAEARASIATLVQQKDAAARTHAKATEGFTKERERLEERTAARERRLLEDVDRARQESKTAAKALAEIETRASKGRAELVRANQALGKSLQELRLEHARLQERLAASDARVRETRSKVAARSRRRPAG